MLWKSRPIHEVMLMVMEECLTCPFMTLYVFFFVLMSCKCFNLFLWLMIYGHHVVLSLLKVDTRGMCCLEGKEVYVCFLGG